MNLSQCDTKIQSACNISLNQNLTTGIENCSNLMTEFRWNYKQSFQSNTYLCLFQGESEHHKGEFHNELQQLGRLENVPTSNQGLQQRKINIRTDAHSQGGGSERPTLRLQKGIERMQEVRGPVHSLHINV